MVVVTCIVISRAFGDNFGFACGDWSKRGTGRFPPNSTRSMEDFIALSAGFNIKTERPRGDASYVRDEPRIRLGGHVIKLILIEMIDLIGLLVFWSHQWNIPERSREINCGLRPHTLFVKLGVLDSRAVTSPWYISNRR